MASVVSTLHDSCCWWAWVDVGEVVEGGLASSRGTDG
jgi:hypothetical protein